MLTDANSRFIWNLAQVLEGIKDKVPPHAFPVAEELNNMVTLALSKLQEIDSRGRFEAVWNVRAEQVCCLCPLGVHGTIMLYSAFMHQGS